MVSAFENDAMEFSVCNGDREVGFCFAAGSKTREELGIEEGYPDCLGWGSPVKKSE